MKNTITLADESGKQYKRTKQDWSINKPVIVWEKQNKSGNFETISNSREINDLEQDYQFEIDNLKRNK